MTDYPQWPGPATGPQYGGAPPPGGPYQPQPGAGRPDWAVPAPNYGPGQGYSPGYGPSGQGYLPYPPQPGGDWKPPKSRKPLYITAGAATAVLAVVGVIIAVLVSARGGGGEAGPAPGGATDVAKAYLEALSRGDAKTALSYGASQPESTDLLTDEVLKKQLAKAAITDIEILGEDNQPGADQKNTAVRVAAKLGGKRTESKVNLVLVDGGWKLSNAAVNVNTLAGSVDSSPDSTLLIFGKPIDKSGHFYVFPGYFELTTSTPYLQVNQPGPTTFDQLNAGMFLELKWSMPDSAKPAIEDAVRAYLTKCYTPGNKPDYCKPVVGGRDWEDYDVDTISLTGPINLGGLKITYDGVLRYAMVMGDLNDIPITVRRKADGQTVPLLAGVWFTQQVDLTQDPPVVVEKK